MVSNATDLRVTLKVDGGFTYAPGLARPIELSAAQLGGERAQHLQRLCEAACALSPKRRASAAAPVRDGRRYRLNVEMEGSRREVITADPVLEPAYAELIAFIEEHGRR